MNFLWFILIGLAAGFLAGVVMKGHGFGVLGNIVVGILGALLGGFIFSLLGIGANNLLGDLICAFVGAVVLLVLIGFVGAKALDGGVPSLDHSNTMQKIIGVALIAGGVALMVMGHNITQAVGPQIAHAFTGETPNKAIYYYIGGGVLCVLGLGALFAPGGSKS